MDIQDPLAIYCYLSMFYDYTLSSPELSKLWQVSVRLGTGSDLPSVIVATMFTAPCESSDSAGSARHPNLL